MFADFLVFAVVLFSIHDRRRTDAAAEQPSYSNGRVSSDTRGSSGSPTRMGATSAADVNRGAIRSRGSPPDGKVDRVLVEPAGEQRRLRDAAAGGSPGNSRFTVPRTPSSVVAGGKRIVFASSGDGACPRV